MIWDNARDTVGSSMLNMTRICASIWRQTKLLTTRRSAACWMIFRTSLSWQWGRQKLTIDETILDRVYIYIHTEYIYIYKYEICVYIYIYIHTHYSWKKWIACGLVVLLAVYLHLFSASDTTYIVLEPPSTQISVSDPVKSKSEPSRHDTKFALSFQCLRRFFVRSRHVSKWFKVMILARSFLSKCFRFLSASRKQTGIKVPGWHCFPLAACPFSEV